jgi:hypothetical protein
LKPCFAIRKGGLATFATSGFAVSRGKQLKLPLRDRLDALENADIVMDGKF